MTDAVEAPSPEARKRAFVRLGVLAVFLIVLAIVAERVGVAEHLSRERIRALIDGLGPLGVLAFVGLFVVGELAHVPGFVFIGAAILAYGRVVGGLVGYGGALIAMAVGFVVVRAFVGQALGAIRRPIVVRALAWVEARPILAVAGLRSVLWMTPTLTYVLALSPVRFRDYMLGTALGLVLPVVAMSVFFDWLLS